MENSDFFTSNRKKIQNVIKEKEMFILYSGHESHFSEDQFYPFRVNKNFFYFTGITEKDIYYILFKIEGRIIEKVFIPELTNEKMKWSVGGVTKDQISDIFSLHELNIYFTDNFKKVFKEDIKFYDIKKIYVDYNEKYNKSLLEEIKSYIPKNSHIELENALNIIKDFRMIKEDYEIECLTKAIDITDRAIKFIARNLKDIHWEYEIEAYFHYITIKDGVKFFGFKPIIASGKNATILHYEKNDSKIEENSLILLDLGVEYENYTSDISRTIPKNGIFTEQQRKYYEIVLNVQKETINNIEIGMTFKQLNDLTRSFFIRECIKYDLITDEKELENYYYHSVSHPLGLDAHDLRAETNTIHENMVITVEPGLYIKELGIGIRIEDDILVKKDKIIVLSGKIPKEIDEIEKMFV